ncbi:MAG: pyruvate dehydrogenase complex dihydrolipoamide acetyltransferase, partial [Pseudobdellovibrionaceae bacterium]
MPINITMPALSPTMEEGTLARWLKKEGDEITAGDVIAEIETDKATMEVEAVDEGILGKIIVSGGTEGVKVNDVIAVLLEEGETANDIGDVSSAKPAPASAPPKEEPKAASAPAAATPAPAAPTAQSGDRVFASPLARRIAKDKGIDLKTVTGSGPRGRIVKADVEGLTAGAAPKTAAEAPKVAAAPSTPSSASAAAAAPSQGVDAKKLADAYGMEYELVPNNNMRKVVAKRLLESKQTVPHFYLTVECQIDGLLNTRAELNAQGEGKYKLSVNDFVVKAVAQALQTFPAANVAWSDEAILQFKHSDISVAVATPNGLITPIVKAAEGKGLATISAEIKDMAGRAKEGKLKPEEFQGGTFSVSNLGMFGVTEFDAIINPPQACILAVGAGVQKPYVKDGAVAIGSFMNCTLSVDHRAVDGAVGAEFL